MTQKESSRATNPPYLGDYHRMRLYPRHWDMSSITAQSGSDHARRTANGQCESDAEDRDMFGVNMSSRAFDEWQIGRHYPDDDTYRCDTFAAF
ncbi:MAG: hypothetical protein Kow0088_21170 [Anaerolineales bacterium]